MLSFLRRSEKIIPRKMGEQYYARTVRERLMEDSNKRMGAYFRRKEAYFVVGEFSSVSSVRRALCCNYTVHVLMGPKLTDESRDEVISLKKRHPDRLRIYQAKTRPRSHGMQFDDVLFFEDEHDGQLYKNALLIEHASKKEISYFRTRFNEDISGLNESSLDDLKKCPTCPKLME